MSKIVSIKEDEHSRFFSNVKKLVTNTSDGSIATWIPEDEAADYVEKQTLTVTENGTYKAKEGTIFDKVDVNVTKKGEGETDDVQLISSKTITQNGDYKAKDDAGGSESKQAGYESVTVALPLEPKTITKNGVYNAADEVDSMGNPLQGYSSLDVQVGDADNGRQISKDIKKNGTYKPEDEPNDGKGEIVGYNQVNVALPLMEKKVIDHGGIFRPQSEQDENGNEYQGYKSIAVNIKITQPVMDFTLNVDHKPNIQNLPFEISIGNTSSEDYDSQDIENPPVVDFSNATIKMYSSGISAPASFGGTPFTQNNLNMGAGAIWKRWPDKVDDKEINSWADSKKFMSDSSIDSDGTITEASYRIGGLGYYIGNGKNRTEVYGRIYTNQDRFRIKQEGNVTKFIFSNAFTYSDNSFVIAANGYYIGWLVENVSFNKGDRFSFTISIKCPSA